MAVIKTGNTTSLVEDIVEMMRDGILGGYDYEYGENFTSALGGQVAEEALFLLGELGNIEEGASSASDSNSENEDGSGWTESSKTTVATTSATHTVTLKGYEDWEGSGWLETGSEKYTFTGSNLNGAVEDKDSLATKFDYSSNVTEKKDAPGYIGSGSDVEKISASVGFNLNDPSQITVKNFTASETEKWSGSGFYGYGYYGPHGGATSSGSFSESVTFKGESSFNRFAYEEWNWDEERNDYVAEEKYGAELVSAKIQSLSVKGSESYKTDGDIGWGSDNWTDSWELALTSDASGLTIDNGADGLALSGKITGLTYGDKEVGNSDDEGSYSGEDYFKYTDTAAASDDLDLSKLEAALNALAEPEMPEAPQVNWPDYYAYYDPQTQVFDQAAYDAAVVVYGAAWDAYDAAWDSYYAAWDSYEAGAESAVEALRQELLKGNDTITVTVNTVDGGTPDGHIQAGAGNDRVTGNIGDDILEGEEGDDTLIGGKGDDELIGGAGNDSLDGGEGDDTLEGGEGKDILKGGAGDDELYGEDGDDSLDGGAGHDWLDGGEGNDRLDGGAGNDFLYGGAGSDTLLGGAGNDYLDGGEEDDGADILDGGAGNDYLRGRAGDDTLKGGAGQDILDGGEGNDTLDGGAGNDVLIGSEGKDILTGGSGLDAFVFGYDDSGDAELSQDSLDVIKDFNVKQDSIVFNFGINPDNVHVLTKADTNKLGTANSYADLFAAAEGKGSLVVGYDSANAYVFADSNDDGQFDLAIQLVGVKGDASVAAIQFDSAGYYA